MTTQMTTPSVKNTQITTKMKTIDDNTQWQQAPDDNQDDNPDSKLDDNPDDTQITTQITKHIDNNPR
jgi:hypothetical protein